jgi:hypothetical protein
MLTSTTRALSQDTSTDRTQANIISKLVHQDQPQASTDGSPNGDQISHQTSNATPIFTRSPSQPVRGLDHSRWGEKLDEGARSDLSRYVQHNVSVDVYRRSIPFEPDPSWQHLSTDTGMEPFHPGYHHYQGSGVLEVPTPLSSTTNPSPMEFPYQSTSSPFTPNLWMDTLEGELNPMEPG